MATFLDVTGLEHFSSIFVFLFVWIVVYATLIWTKVLGQNNFVNILVGLLMGIFVVISPLATSIIADIAPFLAVIFIFILLINIASHMLGGDAAGFPALKGVLLVVIVLVVIVGAAVKIKSSVDVQQQENPKDFSKTINVIFHPKFLGVVFIFAVAIFTIALLASKGG